jgi:hypothetical protein
MDSTSRWLTQVIDDVLMAVRFSPALTAIQEVATPGEIMAFTKACIVTRGLPPRLMSSYREVSAARLGSKARS